MALAVILHPGTSAAPVTTLEISEPKYGTSPVYVNSLTTFSLTASEQANIWYRWEGYNYTQYTEPFYAEAVMPSVGGVPGLPIPLENGPQTLYFNATGEQPRSTQVYVDYYYPETVANVVGKNYTGNNIYVTPETGIKLTATDPDSGVAETRYRVGDGTYYIPYVTPIKLTGNSGFRTIYYYSADNLDNREPEKNLTVYLDSEPPAVNIVPGDPKAMASDNLFARSSTYFVVSPVDISGISATSYRIDGGIWTTYTGAFTVPGEGMHTITARATDNLGQQSPEVSLTFLIDDTPPVVDIVGHDSDKIQIKAGDQIELTCSDSGVGGCVIRYSTDGGTKWNVYSSPLAIQSDTELVYYASDSLGNDAEHRTLQITVAGSPGRPWTFYLGIVILLAATGYMAFSFFPRKKKESGAAAVPEKKKIKPKEDFGTKPKRKKRNY